MPPKLSLSALQGLRRYKYASEDKSLLTKYVLNPFWSKVVLLFPETIAPNVITLLGLSLVGFNVAQLIYLDPGYSLDSTLFPRSVFYFWAFCLFAYQTLDAIDGKQARRTGMASPLGEMFDHGCDAINTTLEVILACYALNLGRSRWTISCLITSLAAFYLTTWEEYYTHQLYLGVISGPVEGILMICGIFIISGKYGPQVWDTKLGKYIGLESINFSPVDFVLHRKLSEAFMVFGGLGLAYNIYTSGQNVARKCRKNNTNPLYAFKNLLPFVITTLLYIFWLSSPTYESSTIIRSSLILPFLAIWGFHFANQVGRMILAHVTSQPFPFFDKMWIWTLVLALDANSDYLYGTPPRLHSTPKDVAIVVYITLAVVFVRHAHFVVQVIQEVTDFLGIACFSVQKRGEDGKWHDARETKAQPKKEL